MLLRSTVPSVSRAYAVALVLGFAMLGGGARLAQAQPRPLPQQAFVAPGLLPPLPNDSYLCDETPQGKCALDRHAPFASPVRD
jgi:hypothetical protein